MNDGAIFTTSFDTTISQNMDVDSRAGSLPEIVPSSTLSESIDPSTLDSHTGQAVALQQLGILPIIGIVSPSTSAVAPQPASLSSA